MEETEFRDVNTIVEAKRRERFPNQGDESLLLWRIPAILTKVSRVSRPEVRQDFYSGLVALP